jgi:hypothetical protein
MALSYDSPETNIDDSLNINAAKAGLSKLEEYSIGLLQFLTLG